MKLFRSLLLAVLTLSIATELTAQKNQREFYELRTYHYQGDSSEQRLDNYLKNALVPALHRANIQKVGVFKSSKHDTATIKKFVVLIPFRSLDMIDKLDGMLEKDNAYQSAGSDYINAAHNNSPYLRIEKTILKAFPGMPQARKSGLKGDPEERIYELRSYESATEKLYRSKVKMFNTGDEIGIFDRLGFNAIFYSEVLAGRSMPNLIYMISFDNLESRNEHWKAFGNDPAWKKLLTDKQYDNTVSHIDSYYLTALPYSDL